MPNRIIKESIRTSKSVNGMSDFEFRLWVHLITYVDDYGRGSADPELLKGFVFPRRKSVTESAIAKTLSALATTGLIRLYEVDGEPYLCFPNWAEHQRIQTKKSKFPAPDENNPRWVTVGHGESPPESNPNTNPNPNPNPNTNMGGTSAPRAHFTPPSVQEVETYCQERGNSVNAQQFVDYYTSNGWTVGRNRMRDWKAAVRTWESREAKQKQQNPQHGSMRILEMMQRGEFDE